MQIEGRSAIVTGAGSGIGRALALELAAQGASVVCTGRRKGRLDETVARIEAAGGTGAAIAADVTQPRQVERLVGAAVERYGGVDILYNNAGSFNAIGGLWEVDPETWWGDVAVNLRGVMLCCRAVLAPMMRRDSGIIINMDGGGSTAPMPGGSGYACSKAALLRLTDTLARELESAGSSILVVALGPGLVRTEMTEIQADTEAGRKWLPSTADCFQKGKTRPPEGCATAMTRLIRHACGAFNGRVFGPDSDFEALARRGEQLRKEDLLTLRFRSAAAAGC